MKKVIVSALIYNDGKLLLARRCEDQLWTTPGGKVETNESLDDALKREVLEETGIEVRKMKMFGVIDFPSKVIFMFLITSWTNLIVNTEPEKHSDWEWISHIPDDSVPGLVAFREGNFVRTSGRP